MNRTGIEYLTHTWSPIAMRCSPVSAGCANCWHLRVADRHAKNGKLDPADRDAKGGRSGPMLNPKRLDDPVRRKKPATIGVQFMGDLFHDSIPFEWVAAVFGSIIASAPAHRFVILTKRPDRMASFFQWVDEQDDDGPYSLCLASAADYLAGDRWSRILERRGLERPLPECEPWPLPNVWLGVSIEDQASADERIPKLLEIDAAVRWVSYEPALGPVEIGAEALNAEPYPGLDWVVAGAETGNGARPAENVWFRSVLDDCVAAGVPFFFKRDSEKRADLDGEIHQEFPR